MNLLITGGCGHIGSHLIRSLPRQYNLTVVDNFLTQRYCSLFNLKRQIKFLEKETVWLVAPPTAVKPRLDPKGAKTVLLFE